MVEMLVVQCGVVNKVSVSTMVEMLVVWCRVVNK